LEETWQHAIRDEIPVASEAFPVILSEAKDLASLA
jgi:hypothetical protein